MNYAKLVTNLILTTVLFVLASPVQGRDLRINLPRRSKLTPVQKLNQDGVKAVQKGDVERGQKLFYRAYLLDPDNPYTLNNLGYISELQGEADRAEKFYELASKVQSESAIADATTDAVKGHPIGDVTQSFGDRKLAINRGNVLAMGLLSRGRIEEAEKLLLQTLEQDPHNPFTLNNLGFTMENEGELEAAYRYYTESASRHSSDKIVVAVERQWRGKPISEVAERNAEALRHRIETEDTVEAKVARLNLQGVSALNHNDRQKARGLFEQAYKLDPKNAFSLNNMGYVAELDGDQETANEFYSEAREAPGSSAKVTLANRQEMQGMALGEVARNNGQGAENALATERETRRRRGGPVQLKHRDHTPVSDPQVVPNSTGNPQQQVSPPPEGGPLPQVPPPGTQNPQNGSRPH